MAETESTDQEQSSTEQQGGTLPEPGEIIIEKRGAQEPPRLGPVSETPNPKPVHNPNVPMQRSLDLDAAEPRTEPSQSGEASGSADESSGE